MAGGQGIILTFFGGLGGMYKSLFNQRTNDIVHLEHVLLDVKQQWRNVWECQKIASKDII